jgi:hypothetical protein
LRSAATGARRPTYAAPPARPGALATLGPAPQTLFEAGVKTLTVDLAEAPFARDAKHWQSPDDYRAKQRFGARARGARIRHAPLAKKAGLRNSP